MISVPTGSVFFVTPFLIREFGLPPSNPQFTTVPSGIFTSNQNQEWGFINSTFVTVPFKTSGFVSSYVAAKA